VIVYFLLVVEFTVCGSWISFWSGCGFYSEEFAGGPFGGLSGRSGGENFAI
jgi:hypothetical protein